MEERQVEPGLGFRVDYPDEELRKRVESFLRSRHFSALRNLEVCVTGGVATLRGEVGSYYEKQVALDTCRRVAGVICTVDRMQVEQPVISQTCSKPPLTGIKAGTVEPGGAARRLEFPAHSGVSSF